MQQVEDRVGAPFRVVVRLDRVATDQSQPIAIVAPQQATKHQRHAYTHYVHEPVQIVNNLTKIQMKKS